MDITAYVEAVTAHCPYLRPSLRHRLTGWTVYEIASADAGAVEAEIFWAGVEAAEYVRPLLSRPRGGLVCENMVITGSMDGASHKALMGWPHWALKHLYGPVGVMFGKFEGGEEMRDRAGRCIPSPPFSFLPVRAAVHTVDPRFLRHTPDLADALAVAVDDGRDVLAGLHTWPEAKEWAASRRDTP